VITGGVKEKGLRLKRQIIRVVDEVLRPLKGLHL
jgi:hypothetical protein